MRNPKAVPPGLLVLVVLQLLALPLNNAISRHLEQEADWMSLQTTRDAPAETALFRDLTTDDYAEPDPPAWDYFLLEDHPPPLDRIAMVEAWKARQTGR
jgi:STE24 endopeptidase